MKKKLNFHSGQGPQGSTQAQRLELSMPASLFAQGLALHQTGRLADAEKVYNQILATRAGHFDSLHLLGVIHLQRGNAAAAVRQIDTALKVSPNNILALNNRGNALNELRRFEEALASYDRALAVRSDYAEAHSNRGNTLQQLKRSEEALASYDRALKIRPDYAEAYSIVATCCMHSTGSTSRWRAATGRSSSSRTMRRRTAIAATRSRS
jgi:tetratricopeptide (TPR) repeat protein